MKITTREAYVQARQDYADESTMLAGLRQLFQGGLIDDRVAVHIAECAKRCDALKAALLAYEQNTALVPGTTEEQMGG